MKIDRKRFKQLSSKAFASACEDYNLKEFKFECDGDGCYITFKNAQAAVRVSYEVREGEVFVLLYRLLNGELPPYEIFIRPETVINSFYLDDVVTLKSPSAVLDLMLPVNEFTYDKLELKLCHAAKALKEYADDVMQGNFSCFADLEVIVKRRAEEL